MQIERLRSPLLLWCSTRNLQILDCQSLSEAAGNRQAVGACLGELAKIEMSQGNPSEARRLLQRSSKINEELGDRRGLSASLHQLAIIESSQGNPSEARRLWEQSLAIKKTLGDIAGRAATLCMLAQLEASEGNTQKAVSMAEEAVRLLEGVGAADDGTGILQSIRARASGEAPSSSPLSRELAEILKKNSLTPQEEALSETDKAIASAREQGDSSREIMFLLARSILSWNASDVRGCDDSLQQAKETLERAPEDLREELRGMVDQLKSQRSQVSHAQQAESVRLSEEAHRQFQAGDVETAIRSSEASLAASRKEGSQDHVAMSLLALGQMLLVADRVDEAVERLSEGLDVAPELDDADILKAMRAAAESAASARKLQKELETPLDQALEEAGSQEAQAQVLLTRAMALAAREPLEAEPLARRAHELAGRCGMKQLEVAALQARGMIFRALGRNKESDELLQQARQQAEDAGLTSMASSIEEIIEQPIQRDP